MQFKSTNKTKEPTKEVVFRKPLSRKKSSSNDALRSSLTNKRSSRVPGDIARFSSDESGNDELESSSRVLRSTPSRNTPSRSLLSPSNLVNNSRSNRNNDASKKSASPTPSRTRSSRIPSLPVSTSSSDPPPELQPSYSLVEDQLQVSDPDDDLVPTPSRSSTSRRMSRRISRKSFGANTSSFLLNSDSDDSGLVGSSPLVEEEDDEEDNRLNNVSRNGMVSAATVSNRHFNANGGTKIYKEPHALFSMIANMQWKRHIPNLLLLSLILPLIIVACVYMVKKDKHDMLKRTNGKFFYCY